MSDPHDPYRPDLGKPPGTSPYAPPQQQPWGQVHPSGAPAQWAPQSPYGAHQPAPRDGVSLTGFFMSLTCCLGPVALVLGLIGLGRTGRGRREGRWAAVSAIVVGGLGTLAMVAAVGGVMFIGSNVRYVEDASVGDCYDLWFGETSPATLRDRSCTEPHDGEVAAVTTQAEVDDVLADLRESGDRATVRAACAELAPAAYGAVIEDSRYRVRLVDDYGNPSGRDDVACFVDRKGGKLEAPLVD